MWERWNSYSHEDGFGDVGMNSFNHYAYGAIGQWMYERDRRAGSGSGPSRLQALLRSAGRRRPADFGQGRTGNRLWQGFQQLEEAGRQFAIGRHGSPEHHCNHRIS